jgi:hypothetical protein
MLLIDSNSNHWKFHNQSQYHHNNFILVEEGKPKGDKASICQHNVSEVSTGRSLIMRYGKVNQSSVLNYTQGQREQWHGRWQISKSLSHRLRYFTLPKQYLKDFVFWTIWGKMKRMRCLNGVSLITSPYSLQKGFNSQVYCGGVFHIQRTISVIFTKKPNFYTP